MGLSSTSHPTPIPHSRCPRPASMLSFSRFSHRSHNVTHGCDVALMNASLTKLGNLSPPPLRTLLIMQFHHIIRTHINPLAIRRNAAQSLQIICTSVATREMRLQVGDSTNQSQRLATQASKLPGSQPLQKTVHVFAAPFGMSCNIRKSVAT